MDRTAEPSIIKAKFNLSFDKILASESKDSSNSEQVKKSSKALMVGLVRASFSSSDMKASESRNLQGECGEQIPFTYRVIVELQRVVVEFFNSCTPLSGTDKSGISGAYLNSFKTLTSSFCDPFDRQVETATIVDEGALSSDGTLGVEIEVSGTFRCPNSAPSCDIADIGLYDVPSFVLSVNRNLQEETNCTCPIDAIADRGVYESEVIEALQAQVTALAPNMDCQRLSVSDCEFGTIFESKIQVTFANAAAAQANATAIEVGALETLNALFSPEDPNTCNPEFRKFSNVRLVFGEGATRGLELIPGTGRELEDDTTNNTSAPTSFPTATPTNNTDSSLPIVVFLATSGVCSGCTNDIFLSNQASGRKLASFEDAMRQKIPSLARNMQELEATSNCFCGLDATTIVTTLPTIEEFAAGLENKTELVITETVLIANEEPEEPTVPCGSEAIPFTYRVIVDFLLTDESCTSLSDPDKSRVGDAYVGSFNDLASNFCDPFFRQVESAVIIQEGEVSNGTLGVEIEVNGTLRCLEVSSCDLAEIGLYDTPTLEVAVGRRRELQDHYLRLSRRCRGGPGSVRK
jgi:hypothetical protein